MPSSNHAHATELFSRIETINNKRIRVRIHIALTGSAVTMLRGLVVKALRRGAKQTTLCGGLFIIKLEEASDGGQLDFSGP